MRQTVLAQTKIKRIYENYNRFCWDFDVSLLNQKPSRLLAVSLKSLIMLINVNKVGTGTIQGNNRDVRNAYNIFTSTNINILYCII